MGRSVMRERKHDPANQLPCGFSSRGRPLVSRAAHTAHLLTLPTPALQKAFAERQGTCFNSSIRPKMKQQETKQISIKQEKICQSLTAALKSLLFFSSLVAIFHSLYPVFSHES